MLIIESNLSYTLGIALRTLTAKLKWVLLWPHFTDEGTEAPSSVGDSPEIIQLKKWSIQKLNSGNLETGKRA